MGWSKNANIMVKEVLGYFAKNILISLERLLMVLEIILQTQV